MATKPAAKDVTPEMIAGWKAQHDGVFKYVTSDGKVAFFKNPGIAEIEASGTLVTAGKPVQSNKALAKACFLAGDEEIFEEDKYLFGLQNKLNGIMIKVEGELSPL